MSDTLLICLSSLGGLTAILTFAHHHLQSTKQWRADLLSYLEGRVNAELTAHTAVIQEALAAAKVETDKAITRADKFQKDLEVVNQNQMNLGNELVTIKNMQQLRGGMLTGLQARSQPGQ